MARFNPNKENLQKLQELFDNFYFDQEIADMVSASIKTIKKYRKIYEETGSVVQKKLSSEEDTNKKLIKSDNHSVGQIKNPKKILVFDQSSRITGFSYWVDGELKDYGAIDFSSSNNLIHRMMMMERYLIDFITEKAPDAIYFEDIQLQENVDTFKTLAMVLGLCKLIAFKLKIPFDSIHSTKWKSHCGIKGSNRRQQKINAQKYVFNNFKIKVSEDEADAICIGLYAVSLSNKKQYLEW